MCSKALDKKTLEKTYCKTLSNYPWILRCSRSLSWYQLLSGVHSTHQSKRHSAQPTATLQKSSDMRLEAQHVQNSFSWRAPISTSNAQRLLSCKSGRTTQIIGGIRARCACRIKRCVLQREWQMHAQTKRYARCNKHDNRSLTTHGYTLLLCSCVF